MILLTLGLACIVQAGSGLLLHDSKTTCPDSFCANAFHCIAVAAQVIYEASGKLDLHAVAIWQKGTSAPLCQIARSPAHSFGHPGEASVSPVSPVATQIACAKQVSSIH